MKTILRQILVELTYGYWDGGKKDTFDWAIDSQVMKDSKGEFVRIGSFEANIWFHVAKGKTDKMTLSYAKKHIKKICKKQIKEFIYIEQGES